jgi:hypothetical protein
MTALRNIYLFLSHCSIDSNDQTERDVFVTIDGADGNGGLEGATSSSSVDFAHRISVYGVQKRRCSSASIVNNGAKANGQPGLAFSTIQDGADNSDRRNNRKRHHSDGQEGAVDIDPLQSVKRFRRQYYKDVHGKSPNLLKTMVSSPKVLSVMDRINISDNQGVMLIGAVADAIGLDVAEGTISRSTVKRYRESNRAVQAARIKTSCWKDTPLVIHWDGKKLPDATNSLDPRTKIERHGVTVTGIYELKSQTIGNC